MEDVLEVYGRPYDPSRPVVCMDESTKQLHEEVRTPIAGAPGAVERYDSEYRRNGVATLFAAFEPLAGWRHVEVTEQRTRRDFARFIQDLLDKRYPEAKKVVLVMDNLNTHSGASLYETFAPAEALRLLSRLEIHFTPSTAAGSTWRKGIQHPAASVPGSPDCYSRDSAAGDHGLGKPAQPVQGRCQLEIHHRRR
jgi:DDE superfamily endonuclease